MAMEDTIKEHDREISKLFVVTERLADGQERMNDKMDKLIDNTNKYDVSMAQLVETTKHFQESISRAYSRIEKLETIQTTTGCSVFQQSQSERKLILERYDREVINLNARIEALYKWKEWIYKVLIGNGFLLIVSLVGVVFQFIKD